MKPLWRLSIGAGLGVVAILLGVVIGPKAWSAGGRPEPEALYSQAGRDRAFVAAVRNARKSIYLRTTTLALIPFTNELGQASQHGIGVHVEMPMDKAARDKNELQCIDFLCLSGAWLEIGNRPPAAYEGAYMLIDDAVFYYSAAPLEYSEVGIPHSYVRGKKG